MSRKVGDSYTANPVDLERLRIVAEQTRSDGVGKSEHIRRAIKEYLDRHYARVKVEG